MEIAFLFHMTERFKRAIKGVGTQMLQKVWKNMSSIISQAVRVKGGHIEQNSIWKKLLKFFYLIRIETA